MVSLGVQTQRVAGRAARTHGPSPSLFCFYLGGRVVVEVAAVAAVGCLPVVRAAPPARPTTNQFFPARR